MQGRGVVSIALTSNVLKRYFYCQMFFYINTCVKHRGGGGGIPYKNGSGACGKFSKNILAVPEYRLIGVAQIHFYP